PRTLRRTAVITVPTVARCERGLSSGAEVAFPPGSALTPPHPREQPADRARPDDERREPQRRRWRGRARERQRGEQDVDREDARDHLRHGPPARRCKL